MTTNKHSLLASEENGKCNNSIIRQILIQISDQSPPSPPSCVTKALPSFFSPVNWHEKLSIAEHGYKIEFYTCIENLDPLGHMQMTPILSHCRLWTTSFSLFILRLFLQDNTRNTTQDTYFLGSGVRTYNLPCKRCICSHLLNYELLVSEKGLSSSTLRTYPGIDKRIWKLPLPCESFSRTD